MAATWRQTLLICSLEEGANGWQSHVLRALLIAGALMVGWIGRAVQLAIWRRSADGYMLHVRATRVGSRLSRCGSHVSKGRGWISGVRSAGVGRLAVGEGGVVGGDKSSTRVGCGGRMLVAHNTRRVGGGAGAFLVGNEGALAGSAGNVRLVGGEEVEQDDVALAGQVLLLKPFTV